MSVAFIPVLQAALPFPSGWPDTDDSLVPLGLTCLLRGSDDKDSGAPGTSLRTANSGSSAEELSSVLVAAVLSSIWSSLLKTKVLFASSELSQHEVLSGLFYSLLLLDCKQNLFLSSFLILEKHILEGKKKTVLNLERNSSVWEKLFGWQAVLADLILLNLLYSNVLANAVPC